MAESTRPFPGSSLSTRPWFRMQEDEVSDQLNTSFNEGLTADEAAERLRHFGPNQIESDSRSSAGEIK